MRKLHLVGLTTDQKGLIFTARRGSESGGYVVALDAEVLNAIARAQGRPNGMGEGPIVRPGGTYTPGPGAQTRRRGLLTPREMQARLRAGRSLEDVAEEADVEVEWVERFAVPILAEQAQVVELARTLVYVNPKEGASSQPLDEAVAWNLADRGSRVPDDVFDMSWSAYQLHDQVWMVRFTYRSRGRAQEARWELDVGTGELVARNKVAAELAYVAEGAIMRRPPPEADEEPTIAPRAASSRVLRTPRRRATPVEVDDVDDDGDEDEDLDEDLDDDDSDAVAEGDEAADGADDGRAAPTEAAKAGADVSAAPAPADEAAPAAPVGAADPDPDPDASNAATAPAKKKAPPKPRAKAVGAKPVGGTARKPAIKPITPPPPVRGLLVSSGRVTRPAPSRGLIVSSPRMRAVTGGLAATDDSQPSAPPPANAPTNAPAPAPAPASRPAAKASGPSADPAPEGDLPAPTPAPDPRPGRADAAEVPAPGGAGVRKAVAQVTSVRVAASRALVARAMLPKPAPPVVSRPTLEGRVSQPAENQPLPLRPRPQAQPAPGGTRPAPTRPAPQTSGQSTSARPETSGAPPSRPPQVGSSPSGQAQSGRPPLRLQPMPPPASGQAVTPFRRSSQTEGSPPASPPGPPDDDDRTAEHPRSPFTPRPAPTARIERPPVARPAARPAARPGGRPQVRPEQPPADGRTTQLPRPQSPRPQAQRGDARGSEVRRVDDRGPSDRPNDRRPNDRRLDDRGRPDAPGRPLAGDDEWTDGDGDGDQRPGRGQSEAGRPRIAAPPAADWKPSSGRQKPPPNGPPVVAPPTGINEPRPRRRLRRPPR